MKNDEREVQGRDCYEAGNPGAETKQRAAEILCARSRGGRQERQAQKYQGDY
jgi:hypothetical protein